MELCREGWARSSIVLEGGEEVMRIGERELYLGERDMSMVARVYLATIDIYPSRHPDALAFPCYENKGIPWSLLCMGEGRPVPPAATHLHFTPHTTHSIPHSHLWRVYGDDAAAEALADVVIGVTLQLDGDSLRGAGFRVKG